MRASTVSLDFTRVQSRVWNPSGIPDRLVPLNRTLNGINRANLALQIAKGDGLLAIEVAKLLPEFVPPNVNLERDLSDFAFMSNRERYFAVRNGGRFDWKQQHYRYAAFGNFYFGLLTKAADIPESIALRGAGVAQILAGTSKYEWASVLDGPFFDDPEDQNWIKNGFKVFELHGTGPINCHAPINDVSGLWDSGSSWGADILELGGVGMKASTPYTESRQY